MIKTDVKWGDSRLGAFALPVRSQDLMLHYYIQGPKNVVQILNSYFCEPEFESSNQNTPYSIMVHVSQQPAPLFFFILSTFAK